MVTITLGWWIVPLLITIGLPVWSAYRWRHNSDVPAAIVWALESLAGLLVGAFSWIVYLLLN